jgi:release factor glutamine methyltransferase
LQGVRADIVVANPPYLPDGLEVTELVSRNEPAAALFGGPSGIDIPLQFVAAASRILKSGGMLVLEHFEDHVLDLERNMQEHYFEFQSYTDLNNRPRWITARRRG